MDLMDSNVAKPGILSKVRQAARVDTNQKRKEIK